jgi:hypothetical protein
MQPIPRSKILLIVFLLVAFGGLIWAAVYYGSSQKVTLTYDTSAATSLSVYRTAKPGQAAKPNAKPLRQAVSGQSFRLAKGSYYLEPQGPNAARDPIDFVVENEPVVKTVDIDYSADYLHRQLAGQDAAIKAAIIAANPRIAQLYRINDGRLYRRGEWYGATLSYTGPDSLSRDTMRVILRQENGTWKIAAGPHIILTAPANPDVPVKVLKAVNAIDLGLPIIVKP